MEKRNLVKLLILRDSETMKYNAKKTELLKSCGKSAISINVHHGYDRKLDYKFLQEMQVAYPWHIPASYRCFGNRKK
jgi:hypothetical protein